MQKLKYQKIKQTHTVARKSLVILKDASLKNKALRFDRDILEKDRNIEIFIITRNKSFIKISHTIWSNIRSLN